MIVTSYYFDLTDTRSLTPGSNSTFQLLLPYWMQPRETLSLDFLPFSGAQMGLCPKPIRQLFLGIQIWGSMMQRPRVFLTDSYKKRFFFTLCHLNSPELLWSRLSPRPDPSTFPSILWLPHSLPLHSFCVRGNQMFQSLANTQH